MTVGIRTMRRLGAGLVAALVVSGIVLTSPAAAVEDVETQRLAGTDRFATAAEVATAAYPNGTNTVIIASGRAFPDALAGAALAGARGAPVLLTEPDRLPAATSSAIDELGADFAIILGGTAAVSMSVQNSLVASGLAVERLAGSNRYETAAEIGEEIGAAAVSDLDGLTTAIVGTGLNFADALAGGPLAAAGAGTGVHPILLVNTTVPDATEDAIADLGIEQVVILGGTAAVSNSVETELEELTGNDAIRLAGSTRYATAVAVADAAVADFGFSVEEVLLANGEVFADALSGGPLGALRTAPILLTPATTLASATSGFLEANSDVVATITVLGGTAAVSDAVMAAAEEAAEKPPPAGENETVAVSPKSSEDVPNGATRAYTVSGVNTTVDIALLDCDDVQADASNNTVFPNTNGNTLADGTARAAGGSVDEADVENAHISSVNGSTRSSTETVAEPNNDYANNVAPDDGTVTFVVSGPASSSSATVCVTPVVFIDANTDNALNVPATANPAAPTEDFGTGGQTIFSPSAAGEGQFEPHNVSDNGVNKTTNRFSACAIVTQQPSEVVNTQDCKTFRYDDNDIFQMGSAPVTMAVWEAALSPGDDVQGNYAPTTSGVSTFNLTDEDQGDPTISSAQGSSTDGVANVDDVHQLVFSEPISTAASDATYQVSDADGTVATISCGGASSNALCTRNASRTTLRARLTGTPSTSSGGSVSGLQYPLTVTATNVEDDDENAVVLGASGDRVIEQSSLTGDVAGPIITGAVLVADTDPANFNSVGDVMHVTFNESVAETDEDNSLTEMQLEAILGVNVNYRPDTVVTIAVVNATTFSLTVSGGDFLPLGGVEVGDEVPGTGNTNVVDTAANNPQAANPTPATLTSSA